jgi:hypothetical protein
MTDDIKPALSAEEWGDELKGREADGVAHWPLVDYSRHALAALCLYGHPFGFTRADLEALADVLRQPLARGTAAPLVGLSHRIAALLPPETT